MKDYSEEFFTGKETKKLLGKSVLFENKLTKVVGKYKIEYTGDYYMLIIATKKMQTIIDKKEHVQYK